MLRSLVGSEMCIRDRCLVEVQNGIPLLTLHHHQCLLAGGVVQDSDGELDASESDREGGDVDGGLDEVPLGAVTMLVICLLYTSDAADEEDSVDLGGRRIIKKKKLKIGWDWTCGTYSRSSG
eukprot:TRINITY_DN7272_c0_g1_i1.p1 TRINITY_DN7272_c0_g1~~TRINITY_DN7272_c0_g1_i1.p1  ORF type:complete len:122 (+),score=27.53 TRINITY_DN7272_c0_g1_i1:176-541(+)